ncbi:hypothetical protein PHISCL_09306 [Aspergillus sclerotialis]|uniref:Uncharacterized protein n=1 Tax=Aspergillus sclerotialis TaxID=2070753 RepID=A0A3A2Z5I2_9EURO|nr:hypothetical protein PHISCL_09306 [Aspergillus sclerotialis]
MPPIGTPSPFRIPPPRTNPSRPNPSSQFASTPRFLLSQDSTPRPTKDKDDIDGDESPYSTPVAARWAGQRSRQGGGELIEDSEDNLSQDIEQSRPHPDGIDDRDISSSPPEATGTIGAEFDILFGSPRDRSKRRRISLETETPATQRGRATHHDPIFSSSPNEPPNSPQTTSPVPRRRIIHQTQEPTPSRPIPNNTLNNQSPIPSTPATTKTPFRNLPRFKISSIQQPPPSSQSQFGPVTPFPARDTSPPRRKPGFVIPRSPSPTGIPEEDPSIPTPFSPSSRTLHRRGRGRGGAQEYVPGGMAAEVRSWILEMGTKREQLPPDAVNQNYLLTARVEDARRGGFGSSGPVTFVVGRCVRASGGEGSGFAQQDDRNIVLFGAPKVSPQGASAENMAELKTGNLVGIYRGLVWEVELDKLESMGNGEGEREADPRPGGQDNSREKEKWLVCMEWDLLE